MKLLVVRMRILVWPSSRRGKAEEHSSYTLPPPLNLLFAYPDRTIVPFERH